MSRQYSIKSYNVDKKVTWKLYLHRESQFVTVNQCDIQITYFLFCSTRNCLLTSIWQCDQLS